MGLRRYMDYTELDDKQIVELILALPHNEEAAAYLLHNRYNPLLRNIYRNLTDETYWFEDCIDELHLHLRGKDSSWQILADFEWRSTFGCWLTTVAKNKFREVLPKLIENRGRNRSLDNNDQENPTMQIPDGGEEEYERRMRKVMLMEAIGQLKDDDQRFVMLKRLEGYDSNEIALLLQKRWEKHGIVKYGYKKGSKEKHVVVPDASYVDIRTQRAKKNLKKIIGEI